MSILEEAKSLQEKMVRDRRYFHQHAELHFDLPLTIAYVMQQLEEMGYAPKRIGGGVVALAGGKQPGKTFLIRGDMDALPIAEENDLPYRCDTGNMHACGHDFHTAMLLGAARILKNHESEIHGQVKLMFQPAEETLAGAKKMIEEGILETPKVDAAMMLHVMPGVAFPTGSLLILDPVLSYVASDWFRIDVTGRGCHGAMPNLGVDPINVMAHIHLALQTINAREVMPSESFVLTIGQIHGGTTSNVIPETGFMTGTIRTTDNEIREYVRTRLTEVAENVAVSLQAKAEVTFERGCPCMRIDAALNQSVQHYALNLLGRERVIEMAKLPPSKTGFGSEDFSYIAELVPSVCVNLSVGMPEEGFVYPIHHPKVLFDEDALPIGAAIYANTALEWLKDHKR